MELHKINKNVNTYIGDCLEVMRTLHDKSIDLIITSPPYFQLRDYENDNSWGNENSVQQFINKINEWGKSCFRVLKDSGSLFLNIGDKYKNKSLMLIPERIAIALNDNGWILRNTLIWNKPNTMPSAVKDRFNNSYEFVYFFVKKNNKYYNHKYYSNIDVLRTKHKTKPPKKYEAFPQYLSIEEYETTYKKMVDEVNNKQNYNGKFKNQTINKGKSPGARQSQGIKYSLCRKTKISKEEGFPINKLISEAYKKQKKYKIKDIDDYFNYKDTFSHYIRLDHSRTLPKPNEWFKLKELLNITETKYDKILTEEHYVLQNVRNNPNGKTPNDILIIPTEPCKESHFAVFPTELPRRIIKAFCPNDGIVLDPFAGSGTTAIPCMEQNKKCILIDCNPNFLDIIKKRLKEIKY